MAKSTGNILTVSVLKEKGYDPMVYRMFCLQSHYRKPLEFSYEVLSNMASAYNKLLNRIKNLNPASEQADAGQVAAYKEKFISLVGNDLNTASGLSLVYDVLKDKALSDATKLAVIEDFDQVLSLDLTKLRGVSEPEKAADNELVQYIEERIAARKAAKKAKDFATADAIRAELLEKGVAIKDTREGTVWELV